MAIDSVNETGTGAASDQSEAGLVCRLREALADDLRVLAALHDREARPELLLFLRESDFPATLTLTGASDRVREGAGLLTDALAAIGAEPQPWVLDELAADYAAIYLNHGYHASPCESVWIDPEQLALQDATFQIRSWYRRFGLAVENWRVRSDDHLVAQLHFLEILFRRPEEADVAEVARFMDEHLLRWLSDFAARVASRCATRFYAGVALLTAGYCEDVRDVLARIVGEPRPTPEEIEKRMKPKPAIAAVPVVFHPGTGPSW